MSNYAIVRIKGELRAGTNEPDLGIKIECLDDTLLNLRGQIRGPPDTPYEGGVYNLEIKIPETYPTHPPKIRFLTEIWHPNISSVTGAIYLDILESNWCAGFSIRTTLISIQVLMHDANPDDPQGTVVAEQYKDNRALFNMTAKYWAQHFAHAPGNINGQYEDNIRKIIEMGFPKSDALQALSAHNWNMESAVQYLLRLQMRDDIL